MIFAIEDGAVIKGEVVVDCDVEDGEAIVGVFSDVVRDLAVVSVLIAVE